MTAPIRFDFRAHHLACRAANRVATFHAMGQDTYAVEQQGEISLVDRATLMQLITWLAQGGKTDGSQVEGGDV